MEIENNLVYKLRDRLGELIVFPLGESDFVIEYEREADSKLSYKKNMTGKLTLVKQAFSRIMELEASMYRCDEQEIEVSKDCGSQIVIFTGKISLNEADFDLDKCTFTTKFLQEIEDKCIDSGKGEKINMFNITFNRVEVKPVQAGGGVYENRECFFATEILEGQPYGNQVWCSAAPNTSTFDTTEADLNNWVIISNLVSMMESPNGGGFISVRTKWAREIVEIGCSDTPSTGWVLVENTCPLGNKKYAKKPDLYDCKFENQRFVSNWDYSFFYTCKILGDSGSGNTIPSIDNGIHMTEFFTNLLSNVCPELELKSDFFQINPNNETDINYVTGIKSTVNNIIIFQKADVKRPLSYNTSMNLQMSLDEFLKMLTTLFNVRWRIAENVFTIEHVSFFSKEIGFNIPVDYAKYFVGKRAYSYDDAKIPPAEIFDFKEKSSNPDWKLEVQYKGCVSTANTNPITYILENVMTDVLWAISNSSSDSQVVDDIGVVMISTSKLNDEYYINSEDSDNGRYLNNVFSWAKLFRDFHHYERPMKTGFINNNQVVFNTTIPTKKGVQFAIPLNLCKTVFNPDKIIKTALGDGIISDAKYRVKDSFLELNLLYESNNDLKINKPPTISGGGLFVTYKNVSKTMDITTADEDGTVTEIIVIQEPFNGTLNISLTQVEYIPNVDYIGADFFSIAAKDNLSEISNTEYFSITIRAANLPPVAIDDDFEMVIGQPFTQQLSIFANDYDDFGFFLVDSNLTTNEGVDISISSIGFFSYVPPVGFDGDDYFDYTIEDDAGLQSTARVTIHVRAANKPVGVTDFYQTLKNISFQNTGGLGKENVLDNDYSPDGISYPYTTTAEIKPTLNGGSVNIAADGTFNYTPPLDFLGTDEFNYTVSNVNGSGVGLVKISVLPRIYVSLIISDLKQSDIINMCGEPPEPSIGGNQRTNDIVLNFYSNAGKTVPFDVTGLNFKVGIKETTDSTNTGVTVEQYKTGVLSGISYVIYDDYVTYQQIRDCNFQLISQFEKSFEIISGAYN